MTSVWACHKCTYLNAQIMPYCEICNTTRMVPPPPPNEDEKASDPQRHPHPKTQPTAPSPVRSQRRDELNKMRTSQLKNILKQYMTESEYSSFCEKQQFISAIIRFEIDSESGPNPNLPREEYAAYVYQFGYPPKQPGHLIAFAKKRGVNVTWTECKNLMKENPDVSDYVPPADKDGQTKKAVIKTEEEKKSEKMETAKRYSSNKMVIDQTKLMSVGDGKLPGMSKRSSAAKYQYLIRLGRIQCSAINCI